MYNIFCIDLAELMELADMQDLGSCGRPCGFESHIPHSYYYHRKENEERAYHRPKPTGAWRAEAVLPPPPG